MDSEFKGICADDSQVAFFFLATISVVFELMLLILDFCFLTQVKGAYKLYV